MSTPNSPFSFPFDADEAIKTLKAGVALMTFWTEINPDYNIAREFEDSLRSLAKVAEKKRIALKQKQLDLKP